MVNAVRTVETVNEGQDMTYRIVQAVDAVEQTDSPMDKPPLYDVIDAESLGKVLDTESSVTVEFEYSGHSIIARSDGTVSVDGVLFEPEQE